MISFVIALFIYTREHAVQLFVSVLRELGYTMLASSSDIFIDVAVVLLSMSSNTSIDFFSAPESWRYVEKSSCTVEPEVSIDESSLLT